MEWGALIPALKTAQEKGQKVPSLDNQPQLIDDIAFFFDAFMELSVTRAWGMGPNAITYQEMNAWLDMNQIKSQDEREEFVHYIKHLDMVWMNIRSKKDKAKAK